MSGLYRAQSPLTNKKGNLPSVFCKQKGNEMLNVLSSLYSGVPKETIFIFQVTFVPAVGG